MGERYPCIKITNELFPRVVVTRHKENDGSIYMGPYTQVKELRQILRLMERYFPLRTCSLNLKKKAVESSLSSLQSRKMPSSLREPLHPPRIPRTGGQRHLCFWEDKPAHWSKVSEKMDEAASSLAFESSPLPRRHKGYMAFLSRQQESRLLSKIQLIKRNLGGNREFAGPLRPVLALWRIEGCDISHLSGKEAYGVIVVFEQGLPNPHYTEDIILKR